MEKLHGLYCVISKKTIRKHEKKYKRFKKIDGVPGTLVKTNRGYFIDGHEVDRKSVELYFNLCKQNKQ